MRVEYFNGAWISSPYKKIHGISVQWHLFTIATLLLVFFVLLHVTIEFNFEMQKPTYDDVVDSL